MEQLNIDQMENLIGGSDYCTNLGTILFGGQFQGSLELFEFAVSMWIEHCEE